ncbi:hypothetical protein H072_8069 [Dactylellina haptotyla CBS 200.50]|uniref:DUF7791 domain-containing protein n=1 Tax=Dactylellina haptotyla (strain CBS 200.50) TaxID=1284197 RepID=S8A5B6_DACHA|nr:hypothetical protein H072_8069 [Dactylellina haptotyla CBS 200.50]
MAVDPLAALGAAAAVLQFLDFTTKLISKGRELYKSADGVLTDHAEQVALYSRLSKLNKALGESINTSAAQKQLSLAEQALLEVSSECMQFADDLAQAIDKLRVTGNRRKWNSFRQALKSVWMKDEIDKRMVTLDRLRQQVIIHLLICMNEKPANIPVNAVTDTIRVEAKALLDAVHKCNHETKQQIEALKHDLATLASQQNTLRGKEENSKLGTSQQLVDRWLGSNSDGIDYLLNRIHQAVEDSKGLSYQCKVLDSLHFERIEYRHGMIDKAHEKTLNWVFDPQPGVVSNWAQIPEWLNGSHGIYWVSGKAGSEKSTLMKWIVQTDRMVKLLESWGGDKRWRSYDLALGRFPAWNETDLLFSLRKLAHITASNTRICLFIDGLDEFEGEEHQRLELLDILAELSALPDIKICASSRPWELFKTAFSDCPQLRLEDLTRKDIEDYVHSKLMANDKFKDIDDSHGNNAASDTFISEITEKAQGVWLWVVLVVRSLLRGFRNRDTLSDLLTRLRETPSELEQLFMQMLSKIENVYRLKTLQLLKIALETTSPTLMTLSFLDNESPEFPFDIPLEEISKEKTKKILELASSRVSIRCLGLLEDVDSGCDTDHAFVSRRVEFLHRSARDFLKNPDTQQALKMELVASFDVDLFICRACVAQFMMAQEPQKKFLLDFMLHALSLEKKKHSSFVLPLLVKLNDLMKLNVGYIANNWYAGEGGWYDRVPRSAPLLPAAIEYGLKQYVIKTLESAPVSTYEICLSREARCRTGPTKEICTRGDSWPLLYYVLRPDHPSIFDPRLRERPLNHAILCRPDIDIVRYLLAHGGNPNIWLGDATLWMEFIRYLREHQDEFRTAGKIHLEPWISATELLIQYGAKNGEGFADHYSAGSGGAPDVNTRERLSTYKMFIGTGISDAFGEEEAHRLGQLMLDVNISKSVSRQPDIPDTASRPTVLVSQPTPTPKPGFRMKMKEKMRSVWG